MTVAPVRPDGTPIDRDAVRARYAAERDKRLRPDGNAQYRRLTADLLADPHAPRTDRSPRTDAVTVAVVGAGFAGLLTAARLKEAGVQSVRLLEKGGGVGGTWYWNRYPGAQCDTASMVYLPLLEETGHVPSEKYAHGPEILEHTQRIAEHYGLLDDALLSTVVTALTWDDEAGQWLVETDRGDAFRATYVTLGTGPLHVPKLPGVPGVEDFRGHSFHTSRWDWAYTGTELEHLRDKRVGVVGTGATAVQVVPHLARACRELLVFQRTPSSVDVRDNAPIDPDWFAQVATPGWQQRWLENFTANQAGGTADEDLVQDGWTSLARRIRHRLLSLPPEQLTVEGMQAAYEDCDLETMEAIRARVDAVVQDRETAQRLKAWYRQLCKRPCFSDAYLQAFDEPGVQLVDTDGRGVERVVEGGVVVAGRLHELDCLVWASGFEVGTDWTSRAGFDVVGRDGVRLSERWADGMRTLHGTHVHGFPNAFFVQHQQGANLLSNIPHNFTEAARAVAAVVGHAEATGRRRVEVTAEAEQAWVDLLLTHPGSLIGSPDCTPGYYNEEGQRGGLRSRLAVGHPAGASAYFTYLAAWRDAGSFEGLTFTDRPSA